MRGDRDRHAVDGDLEGADEAAGGAAVPEGGVGVESRRVMAPGTLTGRARLVIVSSASRAVDELAGGAERVEKVAAVVDPGGRGVVEAHGEQPPEEDADVGEVVTALHTLAAGGAGDRADVDGAGDGVERLAERFELQRVAQVGRPVVVGADVVHVLAGGDELEVFDDARRPAGDVAGELLEDGGGALAAAVADGVGDLGARAAW